MPGNESGSSAIGISKNKMKMVWKKQIWHFTVPVCCLLIGMGAGYLSTRSFSVESALRTARLECERELHGNAGFSQLKLNMCSSFLRQLAEMELAWRQIEVENSADYDRMEADYMKWQAEWEKRLREDRQRSSEFAGGSMEMMDCALRQYELLCEQLEELECKWKNRKK